MLIRQQSLSVNIGLLSFLIGVPFIVLWAYLLYSGRIGLETLAWVSVLLAVDAVLLILFMRGLVRPLRIVGSTLRQVAKGDFTVSVENPYRGELGNMLDDVNHSITSTREMVEQILENTVEIAASSFETVSASAKVVFNVEDEERHVQHISSASQQITDSITGIARNAADANTSAQTASTAVSDGDIIVRETIDSMAQLTDAVGEAATKVETLGESSKRIGEISSVIGNIAEQTNLLALNAAIEAARAGEHGRGFAVVADEVRTLAERTSKATREITDTIQTIQSEISAVIETMHKGVERVERGKETTLRTREAFEVISDGIRSVSALIGQIADGADQQASATQAIAGSIAEIAKVSAGNTQHAYNAVDIIEKMNAVVGSQLRALDNFNIPHKTVVMAKSDHMLWKKRLTEVLLGRTAMRPGEVTDHAGCRFGKWYYDTGKRLYGDRPEFKAIEDPHRRIHETAKRIVELNNAGKKHEAQALLEGLDAPTAQVAENLERLRKGR